MHDIPGYNINEQIYVGTNSCVFRATRESDKLPVVLKFLNSEYPTANQINRFHHEFGLLKKLHQKTEGIVKPLDLLQVDNSMVIAEHDCGGLSLRQIIPEWQFSIDDFILLATKIANIINELHENNVIHKDINPHNIIWNTRNNDIRIIDLGIAMELASEYVAQPDLRSLEGTLDYVSPEQTGRMNRNVDYRSDYYSFGATLYYILTKQPPFQSDDQLEILHAHIAREPVNPTVINPNIPNVLSAIILKLMAKNAEDRYQSMFGLLHDLNKAERLCRGDMEYAAFALGEKDRSAYFQLPQKLYGREHEIESLTTIFDRAHSGSSSLTLITGESGIGKSKVVYEIRRTVIQKNGRFIEGKFDQFNRDKPYSSVLSAFTSLIEQILMEPENQLIPIQDNLISSLGLNAGVITEVIPKLERLIGHQTEPPTLGALENKNRFHSNFKSFVRALCGKSNPLLIFLDDLQWADQASLELIEVLLSDEQSSGLMIVGAFRNNEVDDTHPLTSLIKSIKNSVTTLHELQLKPLNPENVENLLRDCLGDTDELPYLRDICYQKTEGNPFFLGQFLKTLTEQNLVYFDQKQATWNADHKKISTISFTDNVLDLMAEKVKQLNTSTREVLSIAAVMGNQFSLHRLSAVAERSWKEVADHLWPALKCNLLMPLSDNYRYVSELENGSDVEYRFIHDRIQQACYSMIDQAWLIKLHKKIGLMMLNSYDSDQDDAILFDTLSHLNKASIEQLQPNLHERIAELHLLAANKAAASTAYDAALDYLDQGLTYVADKPWNNQYELVFSFYLAIADTTITLTDYDRSESALRILELNTSTTLDKLKLANVKANLLLASGRAKEVIDLGYQALALIGLNFPKNPNKLRVINSILKTNRLLKKHPTDKLVELPKMENEEMIEALRFMHVWASACYQVMPELNVINVCKMIELSVAHGNTNASVYAYSSYGVILAGILGKIEEGYNLAKMSFDIIEKHNFYDVKTKASYMFNVIVRTWKDHPDSALQGIRESYWSYRESGDYDFATTSLGSIPSYHLRLGTPLTQLLSESEDIVKKLEKAGFERGIKTCTIFLWFALKFRGQEELPDYWPETWVIDEAFLNDIAKNSGTLYCIYWILELQYRYTIGELEKADHAFAEATNYLGNITGLSYNVNYIYYGAINKSTQFQNQSARQQKETKKFVKTAIKKMKKWAQHAPMNFAQKHLLLSAELSRMLNQPMDQTLRLYDASIAAAKEHKYLTEEALANELASRYLRDKEHDTIAKTYFQQAYYLYSRWQANCKTEKMEADHPHWLVSQTSPDRSVRHSHSRTHQHNPSGSGTEGNMIYDLESVLKTSQLISGEIIMSSLLKKMMSIILENAGAQKGFMIFPVNGELIIEAEGSVDGQDIQILQSKSIDESKNLSTAIVRNVFHNKKTILLNDASNEGEFTEDYHVLRSKPKSILCYPLINHGELTSILYLENNLLRNAFTPDRLQVLGIISSHIVISIENAKLYQKLEERNKRIQLILAATKEMSRAESKIEAANIAAANLVTLDSKLKLTSARLILPMTNGSDFASFDIWKDGKKIASPSASTLKLEALSDHLSLEKIILEEKTLRIPIQSEKSFLGLLELREYDTKATELTGNDLGIFEGVSRSLALTMENIDSQENERLSSIGAMAASIVHDLKNPIGSIIGYTNLIDEESSTREERLEYTAIIRNEAKRMSDMAHEVLEFSQGQISLLKRPVRSTEFFEDIARTIKPIYDNDGISFTTNITFDQSINLDGDRIRRVILNLATNARDAIVAEREQIQTPKDNYTVTFSIFADDSNMVVELKDNGPGIPEQIRATIFEPFVTQGKSNGTGLGMAIVKKIINAHDGAISFDTKLGEGTTFSLAFPKASIAITDQDDMSPHAPAPDNLVKDGELRQIFPDKLRVLIAEDNPVNQKLLAKYMQKLEIDADIVSNGSEVLAAVNGQQYDIILMDVEMPELNGLETTQIIRKGQTEGQYPKIPIIAMTGHAGEEAIRACIDAGMDDVLSKPVNPSQIQEMIKSRMH